MNHSVIVIGGGPAGLLAAATAASGGASVTLLERMDRPGRKLRICGKGRGNIGNTAPLDEFLTHFGKNFRFLRPALSHFFTKDTIALLDALGVPTKEERGGRLFPASDSAQDLVDAFVRNARAKGVTIRTGCRVRGINRKDEQFEVSFGSQTLTADRIILTTGGASYPATGSTGDGYDLAKCLGHAIVPIAPALVPLITAGDTAARLQGLSLKNVRVELRVDGKKAGEDMGEMLFTHFGLSGPLILTLSKAAVRAVDQGKKTEILIDLKPALDPAKLDARLLRDLGEHGKMHMENLLRGLMPPKLIPVCLEQTRLAGDKAAHQISAEERKRLRLWLKELRFTVSGYRPLREAIITAGGVDLAEVNPKTMQSKICPGLFLAGEILDMDADTGGFNLQAALSTGYLAGLSASDIP
ncbi:MAG: aminoacetone oxidase family FAD-binding enzyme [Deltaproteobacteria bacterium HGW-Deltaproteobacteria-18]|nr:MAG: aminoacetone oxidase family FAD-binding enzyme [Deltaproteobacteria bacterium HGW-Deltaproteobacteria-18]